ERPIRIQSRKNPGRVAKSVNTAYYISKDQLGSITQITNARGSVVNSYTYDPWGRRKVVQSGKKRSNPGGLAVNGTFDRGFTGHEQLDHISLIHMNGRVYDPTIARFVSADPTLQLPLSSQAYDRYSYVWNNPINLTDPTGFGWFSKLINNVGRAIGGALERT